MKQSPFMIAVAVACGLLLVIGVLLVVLGGTTLAASKEPILNAETEMQSANLRGEYISPIDADAARNIAKIQSQQRKDTGSKLVGSGIVFMIPALLLGLIRSRHMAQK